MVNINGKGKLGKERNPRGKDWVTEWAKNKETEMGSGCCPRSGTGARWVKVESGRASLTEERQMEFGQTKAKVWEWLIPPGLWRQFKVGQWWIWWNQNKHLLVKKTTLSLHRSTKSCKTSNDILKKIYKVILFSTFVSELLISIFVCLGGATILCELCG